MVSGVLLIDLAAYRITSCRPKTRQINSTASRDGTFGVAADLSFGDVARTLRELVPTRYGELVSIDCIRSSRSSD